MRKTLRILGCGLLLAAACAAKQLQIYMIDVEGGQSTLFVSPSGQSLLIDTGWPGNAFRDANRILDACKKAHVKKINYLLITHYHIDHVGGVPQLVKKIQVDTFLDHGPNREKSKSTEVPYADYLQAVGNSRRIIVKPGDTIPIKGLDVQVVSSDGNVISNPLPGAGQPNPDCADVQRRPVDETENARSVGVVITYGKFRLVDLGDLTWNKELDLMCPNNKLGKTDLLVVSHHGTNPSNSAALVHALSPRVAMIGNGSKKGAEQTAWDTVRSSPGLQDIWQLHFADAGGKEHNAADPFIANVDELDTGNDLEVTAREDGSFSVYNPRNKFSREYK